jgi:hypothetical protein
MAVHVSYFQQATDDLKWSSDADKTTAKMVAAQADEQRTANLIAFLALPEAECDAAERKAAKAEVSIRLGLSS